MCDIHIMNHASESHVILHSYENDIHSYNNILRLFFEIIFYTKINDKIVLI